MEESRAELVQRLRDGVLRGRVALDPAVRQAAADRGPLPDALVAYVTKVHEHAYRVTDADVAALLRAGYTEDQIFELTISAALGAGLRRLEAGLAALRGKA